MSGIAVLGSLSLIVACGGADSGDSVSASELAGDSVDLVTEKWYVWWAGDDGAAVATAEASTLRLRM
jgi:ABC-type glycerol-3-phosphate transport system substrate-binding protein